MSQAIPEPSTVPLFRRLLTTDFCPWANRFVYWLKEPVGWFALATAVSVLVGLYIGPIGWVLAAAMTTVIAVGMVWPWIAVRIVRCELTPERSQVHEEDRCGLKLAVRNRLPLPIWGLAIEGFLDVRREESEDEPPPTAALAYVRGLATSTYRFSIRPHLRGHYPDGRTTVACSFPFGIWTARRDLSEIHPLTVWPKVYSIDGQTALVGRRAVDRGDGNRAGRCGDFVGIREYRRGDGVKDVNWIATARADQLMVTQRSGPQCPDLLVIVDTRPAQNRDQVTDRIRVAASVLANLHDARIPMRVQINARTFSPRRGCEGFVQIMNALADVPVDGVTEAPLATPHRGSASLVISSNAGGDPTSCLIDPGANPREQTAHRHQVVRRGEGLAEQLLGFWTEQRDANLVA